MNYYKFDQFIIEFDKNIKHQIYNDGYSSGIIFNHEGNKYDITNNKELNWSRIFINYKDGGWKDVPFNENTWALLPSNIRIFKK